MIYFKNTSYGKLPIGESICIGEYPVETIISPHLFLLVWGWGGGEGGGTK